MNEKQKHDCVVVANGIMHQRVAVNICGTHIRVIVELNEYGIQVVARGRIYNCTLCSRGNVRELGNLLLDFKYMANLLLAELMQYDKRLDNCLLGKIDKRSNKSHALERLQGIPCLEAIVICECNGICQGL